MSTHPEPADPDSQPMRPQATACCKPGPFRRPPNGVAFGGGSSLVTGPAGRRPRRVRWATSCDQLLYMRFPCNADRDSITLGIGRCHDRDRNDKRDRISWV
jgi:hypothetical protein